MGQCYRIAQARGGSGSWLCSSQWNRFSGASGLGGTSHRSLIKPPSRSNGLSDKGLLGDYVSVFFLILTNPFTMLAFAGAFATLGVE